MATLIQLLEQALDTHDPLLAVETKRILLKEALQALMLDFLYNHPHYRQLIFYGGTCLHVVYGLNRLSEDIDLDNSQGVDLEHLGDDLMEYVNASLDYHHAMLKLQEGRSGITRLTLRFPVLQVLGLSAMASEALHLKLEVSSHRQVALVQHTPLIFYGRSFVPAHFSLETLMAGKMLACLERSFQKGGAVIKGRDWYDLLWLMQKGVQPLESKLEQDGAQPYTRSRAIQILIARAGQIRQQDLKLDLLPLFEQRSFIENWIASFNEVFPRFAQTYL